MIGRAVVLASIVCASSYIPAKSSHSVSVSSGDTSLTTDEYIALGMPSPDQVWNDADYIRAGSVLTSLAESRPESLPRYSSMKSQSVFKRLTSPSNLQFLRSDDLSIEIRYQRGIKIIEAGRQAMRTYTDHELELFETSGFELIATAEVTGACLRYIHSLPGEVQQIPNYVRMIEQAKLMSPRVVSSAIDFLGSSTNGGTLPGIATCDPLTGIPPRLRFSESLYSTLETFLPNIPDYARKQLDEKVKRLMPYAKDPDLRTTLDRIYTALDAH